MVAILPERLGLRFGRIVGLRLLDLPFETPEIVEAMYWSALTDSDPAHRWLRTTLHDIARGL
jgi:LysR family nod box-dependent transcriptional activator